jgi:hypothetical protein
MMFRLTYRGCGGCSPKEDDDELNGRMDATAAIP